MADLHRLCEKCSEIVTLAPLYKSQCRNSDQIVCIEACAKMCHASLFCTACNMADAHLLSKLHEVCAWCKDICERLQINSKTACCYSFINACDEVCELCQAYRKYRAISTDTRMTHMDHLADCCQALLHEGMIQKPLCLVNRSLDHQGLATVEACLKMCSCLNFMCCNATENVCPNMLQVFMGLCAECEKVGFCTERVRSCRTGCESCMQSAPRQVADWRELIRSLSMAGSP